jgi:hypothetical protein
MDENNRLEFLNGPSGGRVHNDRNGRGTPLVRSSLQEFST